MPRRSPGDAGAGAGRKAAGPGPRRPGGGGRDHGGPRLSATGPVHAARLAPLRPETRWSLEDGVLVERSGPRERRLPLGDLRLFRLTGLPGAQRRALALRFARGRCLIASHSWAGPGRFEDRMASFSALARAIAAQTADHARFTTGRLEVGEAFAWTIGLLAAGAVALIALSLAGGAPGLGLALAARLVFVLILMLAALPWLQRGPARLDPLNLPPDLLPRV